ncbi:MAG: hypothetical protein A2915_03465 [Candidatus Yanofskybacteria bacterium RIFCSPLOWO2_01_FULL_41_34]|uniref:EamA domain-containing protein n=1 Tax=Candidatus Yanofskybacteria bacterium RIFCSPHIGHO2_01_FULL_41_26 TaxID=1802661 RepID=A0A1F8EDQ3_9BACT|nr:MAG: hypothetical protein A2649_01360 [Candidatus Yanofskybacteria bacterium RIFCSPHIGHO2_01_FULL_41_26]OGN21088.1 MAG: hypothetical protein A2915_03465 [Candidatus Yanofskybacteria bacterium RIFCSPLOWO2_01_FULL_41_34]
MLWIYLALTAYFVNAIAFVIDKHLLSSSLPRPFAYAFGVSILSILAVVLIPFGVAWLGVQYFFISFVSGTAFFIALFFLYKSIKLSDVSVASINVATLSAIFTYVLSVFILKEKLGTNNGLAFVFLVLGILFLGMIRRDIFRYSILAGLFFGLSLVLLKWTFNYSDFVNGIFWTRIGFVGSSLFMLVFPRARGEISNSLKNAPQSSLFLFILNKIIAGVGFLTLYYAIQLGNVSLVNALLGVQFSFVFILALIFGKIFPDVAENITRKILIKKLLGISFIGVGFLMLFR